MAIQYKSMVKPMPGSRSQAPMTGKDYDPGYAPQLPSGLGAHRNMDPGFTPQLPSGLGSLGVNMDPGYTRNPMQGNSPWLQGGPAGVMQTADYRLGRDFHHGPNGEMIPNGGGWARTLPNNVNPFNPVRSGDIRLLAGGGGGIGDFFNSQFTPPQAQQTQTPAAPAPMNPGVSGGVAPQVDPFRTPTHSSPLIQGPMQPPGYQMPLQSSLQQGEHAVALNPNPSPVSVHDREVQLMNAMRQRQAAQGQQPSPAAQQGMYSPPPVTSGRPAFDSNASVYGRPQIGGGYVYAPDLRNQQLSPQDQRRVDMDTRWQQADPAGPYSNAAGYNRFQSLQTHQPNTMRPPAPEWQQGHLDAADASQRRARGKTAVFVQTGPPAGGLSADMEAKRQAAVERQRDRKSAYGAGRNIRANERYGAPIREDMFQGKTAMSMYDSYLGRNKEDSAYSGAEQPAPGGAPTKPMAVREANYQESRQHPIFTDAEKKGFDPDNASVSQSMNFFLSNRGAWNGEDKKAFKKYLDNKAAKDPEGFGKQLNDWLSTEFHVAGGLNDPRQAEIDASNEIRKMYGKKPLTPQRQPDAGLPIGG